ncbi:hotdog family protein [Paractinoplanes durhamensis]|uniref:hypothetical protein n=1 Tax=Paractinoplanes durhamensis TaxID=113563 RepID=UPI003634C762
MPQPSLGARPAAGNRPPAGNRPADTAAALGALKELAEHSTAAAELAALLQETATDAVTMLSATARPAAPPARRNGNGGAPPPRNGNGNGNGSGNGAHPAPVPPPSAGVHRSSLRVSMEEMPYLLDHCFYAQPPDWPVVDDRWPVVPATTVAQHMMDAAEAAAPGHRAVAIRDARFNRWLIAAPAQTVETTVKHDGAGRPPSCSAATPGRWWSWPRRTRIRRRRCGRTTRPPNARPPSTRRRCTTSG